MSDLTRIIVVLGLVLGNALFVAAEYALVTARRTRLEQAVQAGSRRAATALRLMEQPVRFISTVQVGITVFGILIGAVGQPLLAAYFDPFLAGSLSFLLAFAILTYLSVVVGELVPKAVALRKAEPLAAVLAGPLDLLGKVVHPLVWVLDMSARGLTRLLGIEPSPAGAIGYTRDDIRHSLAAAEESGQIREAEEEMLYKVFDFADKEVEDVMVPRPQVVALAIDLPPEEALAAVIDSPYTRYPVYRGTPDQIVGILHVRDVFSAMSDVGLAHVKLEELLRPAHIVPETKDLAALLGEFRRTSQHMAVVVDEYGTMVGIVTLEDLLEEIVGEIEDEFDLPDEAVERVDDNTIRIHGTFPIDDFNEQFQTDLPIEDFHTMAGFVFGLLGRAPEQGDEVVHDGLRFEVVETEGSRIDRLAITFAPGGRDEFPAEEPQETGA